MTRTKGGSRNPLLDLLRSQHHTYTSDAVAALLVSIDRERVTKLDETLSAYISKNLPAAIGKRSGIAAYRTNPYVLMSSAASMNLTDPQQFASFLFNTKLYMGLETSFGKSVESIVVGQYPSGAREGSHWEDPKEKLREAVSLKGLSREAKVLRRKDSVWREMDRSVVVGSRRYLVTIKSGPNCINDTQVAQMRTAIAGNYHEWFKQTIENYPHVDSLDIIIGLTYGTDRTTNNKENNLLVALLEDGFVEENRERLPGVLVDAETRRVRVYRCIGQEFWSMIGSPANPAAGSATFIEVLVALAAALATGKAALTLESKVNLKIKELGTALLALDTFPADAMPKWARTKLDEDDLFYLATSLTAFYDVGV